MRLRSAVVLSVVAAVLVTGCAATPPPVPTPTPSATPSPSSSPSPTAEPIVSPEAAFDVTCGDVTEAVAALVGEPEGAVEERTTLRGGTSWHPGPPQYMMQRADGIACSTGVEGRYWQVTVLPDAQTLIDGATARGGYDGEGSHCFEGFCRGEMRDGDVLVSYEIEDASLTGADGPRVEDALRGLVSAAVQSLREVPFIPSELTGIGCEQILAAQKLGEYLGTHIEILDQSAMGGWGIPAEVYFTKNGASVCMYAEGPNLYADPTRVMITTLPAGAWAFESLEGGTAVNVEGADAARASTDIYDRSVLDLRVGAEWLRLAGYDDGSGAPDLVPIAAMVVDQLTQGSLAQQ